MGSNGTTTGVQGDGGFRRPDEYDCSKCPAYCCAVYEDVRVTVRDLRRLAAHLGRDVDDVRARHTKVIGAGRVLRRKQHPLFGSACHLLDQTTSRCTVYEGRPEVCRTYPGRPRCAYYELLSFERDAQRDPDVFPLVQIRFVKRDAPK